MSTTTKTVFLTDENGNLLVDSNGRPRALTFSVVAGKSLRFAERETIPTVTYAELKTYSESVQTYTWITNAAKFSVEDVAVFQYIVSDRGNTRAYITAQVSAVNDTSLTANGIGISVAGADGKNGNDGTTPHIGENKHWYIGEEDTGIVAEGKDGATPEIGENGNWYINGQDTGKSSKGATGDAATISIGTVTTLPAGSQATVENVGDENNAVFNFALPQGAQGEKGGTYVAQLQTSNGEPLQVTAEQIAQNTEFGISNAQNWSAFSQEDIALVNVIVTDNANKAALVIMQIDAPPTSTLITGRVVYVQYEASGGGGGGLQVQEITYANGDSVGTTAATIAAIASSHNIVGCITDQNSEKGISYTVNGLTYDVMNIIPAVDKSGTLYINGYSAEVTSGTAVTFVTVVVTSSLSLTYANGLEFTAMTPNTATTWTRNGSIFVYYQ